MTVLSALGPDHSHSLAARATHQKIVVHKNRSPERIFGQSPADTPTYDEPACHKHRSTITDDNGPVHVAIVYPASR